VSTGRQLGQSIPTATSNVRFTPDGKRVLTTAGFSSKFWDPVTGSLLGAMSESGAISTVIFRADGKLMLAAASDGTLRLREVATGQMVGAPMLSSQQATTAAFSPDPEGKLIVAGYGDGSARLLDSATQKPLGPPVVHAQAISAAAFSADGRSFLTADVTGDTRTWPVPAPTVEPLDRLARRLPIHTGVSREWRGPAHR
jgi:WD40 repeat protein